MATLVIYFILKDVLNLDKRNEKKKDNNKIYKLQIVLNEVKNNNNEIDTIFNIISKKGFETIDSNINIEDRSNIVISINISVIQNRSPNEIFSELLEYEFIKKISVV